MQLLQLLLAPARRARINQAHFGKHLNVRQRTWDVKRRQFQVEFTVAANGEVSNSLVEVVVFFPEFVGN